MNRWGEPGAASFLKITDTQQAQGDLNATFSGDLLKSVVFCS